MDRIIGLLIGITMLKWKKLKLGYPEVEMLFLTLIVPFALCVGGSYIFGYSTALGFLYGFNLTLIYLALWAMTNQYVKVNTQRIIMRDKNLILLRKQLYTSLPVIRQSEIEIPVESMRGLTLAATGIGYSMNLRFMQEEKCMGIDIDINPLRLQNGPILQEVVKFLPNTGTDDKTLEILDQYEKKALSWKFIYLFSFLVLVGALAVFLVLSLFLGTRIK